MYDSVKKVWRFQKEYFFLSNFFPSVVLLDGSEYPSVEHAYQAAKTMKLHVRTAISNCATAGAAKRYGKIVTLRPNWLRVRDSIMYDLLLQKFRTPSLRDELLKTDTAFLCEGNMWHDTYWGICFCKLHKELGGENNLGKMLMLIRLMLKETQHAQTRTRNSDVATLPFGPADRLGLRPGA